MHQRLLHLPLFRAGRGVAAPEHLLCRAERYSFGDLPASLGLAERPDLGRRNLLDDWSLLRNYYRRHQQAQSGGRDGLGGRCRQRERLLARLLPGPRLHAWPSCHPYGNPQAKSPLSSRHLVLLRYRLLHVHWTEYLGDAREEVFSSVQGNHAECLATSPHHWNS